MRKRSKDSRSLSYSPAKRNPERYKDILDKKQQTRGSQRIPSPRSPEKKKTVKKPAAEKPVVNKLRDDRSLDSENESQVSESQPETLDSGENEFLQLKAQLAAKAKESLEKKKTVEPPPAITSPLEVQKVVVSEVQKEIQKQRNKGETDLGPHHKEESKHQKPSYNERPKIAIKPFKISDGMDKKIVPDVFERDHLLPPQPPQVNVKPRVAASPAESMKPPKVPSPSMQTTEKPQKVNKKPSNQSQANETAAIASKRSRSRSTSKTSASKRLVKICVLNFGSQFFS